MRRRSKVFVRHRFNLLSSRRDHRSRYALQRASCHLADWTGVNGIAFGERLLLQAPEQPVQQMQQPVQEMPQQTTQQGYEFEQK